MKIHGDGVKLGCPVIFFHLFLLIRISKKRSNMTGEVMTVICSAEQLIERHLQGYLTKL